MCAGSLQHSSEDTLKRQLISLSINIPANIYQWDSACQTCVMARQATEWVCMRCSQPGWLMGL